MGKEKSKKTKVKYNTAEQEEIVKFLIVIAIVVLAVGGIYVATRVFVTKDFFDGKKENETEEVAEPNFDYSTAIMGQIFNRPYDEYYVAIYDATEGDYIYDMGMMIYNYNNTEKHLHVYTVDLSSILNDGFYDPENVNVNAKTLSELKVGDMTLLKIKKGKIVKYLVDLDKMKQELGLSK